MLKSSNSILLLAKMHCSPVDFNIQGGMGSGARSLNIAPNSLPNFGGRHLGSSPGPVPNPAYSPFQVMLQTDL